MTDSSNDQRRLTAIRVSGSDAAEFLQGQLSCDVMLVHDSAITDGAWLNPAGRVIAVMQMLKSGDDFLLFVAASLATPIVERLSRFRFRSNVSFTLEPALTVGFDATGSAPLATRQLPDATEVYSATATASDEWQVARIAAGLPWIDATNSEKYTAHQLNLDQLDAVSLNKGCYSGQEIVARTAHRGRVKRRARHLAMSAATTPASGEPVVDDAGNKVGEIVCAASAGSESIVHVLALLPVDIDGPLTCAGTALTPRGLPFAVDAA
ncbi:MAG: hypothetical protein AAFX44_16965 [Pseudomonadota bacterium]